MENIRVKHGVLTFAIGGGWRMVPLTRAGQAERWDGKAMKEQVWF